MKDYILFILYLLFILINRNKPEYIEANFPQSILLPKGNIFVLSNERINVYSSNFSKILLSYNFDENEKIENYTEFLKTSISNYNVGDNFYVLCLTKGLFLYLYDNNNNTIKKENINNINDGLFYNLIPYKYYNNSIEYIISYFSVYDDDDYYKYRIKLFLFRLSFSETISQNFLVSNNTIYDIKKRNYNRYYELYLSCQKIYLNRKNLLICFYSSNN